MLYQILTLTIHRKILQKSYKNNQFKILVLTWNDKFELLDGLSSVSDIQDYFEWNWKKKHGEKADNLSMRIYVNKIENRIIYRIKTRYTAQKMKFSIKDFFSNCD